MRVVRSIFHTAHYAAPRAQYLLIPGVGRGSSGGIDEALDVTTGFLIQARDGPAPRPVFALARRERCAHPRAVGTGAGADGAGGGVGSQARPAAEDARQLQPAALAGQEAEPR